MPLPRPSPYTLLSPSQKLTLLHLASIHVQHRQHHHRQAALCPNARPSPHAVLQHQLPQPAWKGVAQYVAADASAGGRRCSFLTACYSHARGIHACTVASSLGSNVGRDAGHVGCSSERTHWDTCSRACGSTNSENCDAEGNAGHGYMQLTAGGSAGSSEDPSTPAGSAVVRQSLQSPLVTSAVMRKSIQPPLICLAYGTLQDMPCRLSKRASRFPTTTCVKAVMR